MQIDASALTRIDLAGETLDFWPRYLFHDRAQTLDTAIGLRAVCGVLDFPIESDGPRIETRVAA